MTENRTHRISRINPAKARTKRQRGELGIARQINTASIIEHNNHRKKYAYNENKRASEPHNMPAIVLRCSQLITITKSPESPATLSPLSRHLLPMRSFIAGATRSAAGKRKGAFADIHPATLGAAVVDSLITKVGMDPSVVDDVIFGCVSQVGAQAGNIGRNVVLSSSLLPESVPGTAVDRQCEIY